MHFKWLKLTIAVELKKNTNVRINEPLGNSVHLTFSEQRSKHGGGPQLSALLRAKGDQARYGTKSRFGKHRK